MAGAYRIEQFLLYVAHVATQNNLAQESTDIESDVRREVRTSASTD
jgi:hypothetical protein